MSFVTCPKCKGIFPLTETKGNTTQCMVCNTVFETDKEVELSDEQLARLDQIYEAAYQFCKVLTDKPKNQELDWDMQYIGEITDYAVSVMVQAGHHVRYPAVVTQQDGSQYIEEICSPDN